MMSSGPFDTDQKESSCPAAQAQERQDEEQELEEGFNPAVSDHDKVYDQKIMASHKPSGKLEVKQGLNTRKTPLKERTVCHRRGTEPEPGAVAVAGMSLASATVTADTYTSNSSLEVNDEDPVAAAAAADSLEQEHYVSTVAPQQTTVVSALVVNEEDEQQRLQQAKDHGREEVLKNAVVADARIMMPDQDHPTKLWNHCICGLALLALIVVAVAVVVGSVVAIRPSDPAPSPIVTTTSVFAPTLMAVTTPAPVFPTMAPSQFHYNNTYCFTAQPVVMDGAVVMDSQVGKSPQALGVIHPCDNSKITYGVAGWYWVRGNGRVATIRVCRCASIMYVAAGECSTSSIFQPNHCHLSATRPNLEPLNNGCFEGAWPTVPGADYYMAVGTVLDAAVSCENQTYTVALKSNDYCKNAYPIKADASRTLGSTLNATRDNIGACGDTDGAGDTATRSRGSNTSNNAGDTATGGSNTRNNTTSNGVWYTITGTGQTLTFGTCGSEALQTQLSIYTGACVDQLKCVAAATTDYDCENQTSVSWLSKVGVVYYLMVHGADSGPFTLTGFQSPPNDICEGAVSLSLEPSSSGSSYQYYYGSTIGATFSNDAVYLDISLSCGLNLTESPGVWYQLDGLEDGLSVSVDTCSSSAADGADETAATSFQPNLVVIEGQFCAADLTCPENAIYSNACGRASDAAASSNRVTWSTRKGETYFLFVYGNSKNETGDFVLTITNSALHL